MGCSNPSPAPPLEALEREGRSTPSMFSSRFSVKPQQIDFDHRPPFPVDFHHESGVQVCVRQEAPLSPGVLLALDGNVLPREHKVDVAAGVAGVHRVDAESVVRREAVQRDVLQPASDSDGVIVWCSCQRGGRAGCSAAFETTPAATERASAQIEGGRLRVAGCRPEREHCSEQPISVPPSVLEQILGC